MPKFNCSYAYCVSCYADFTVEAENEEEAEKIIERALENGCFASVSGDPSWEDTDQERVFVSGPTGEHEIGEPMENLVNFEPEATREPKPEETSKTS